MKAIILAGGYQSTLSNIVEGIPKPMVEIGGKPLLWHIMKHFSQYGIKEFIVCGGYKVDKIKNYFNNFYIYESDITVDLSNNTMEIHKNRTEDWKVTVVDTGLDATPGERIVAVRDYILRSSDEEDFIVTYGDCLSNINVKDLTEKHKASQKQATLVMAKPLGRKKLLSIDENGLLEYERMNPEVEAVAWVNADCFVMKNNALDFLKDNKDLESQFFRNLSYLGQVNTYKHEGYWSSIETQRDLVSAEKLWEDYKAPWINK